jgi:hypothetical protein
MSATRTEAQKQAARENGKKSHGPKTEDGKRRSRRNSTKDGLSPSTGTILPEALAADVERQIGAFKMQFRPRDAYEEALVRTAAVASARFAQLTQAETALTQSRLRHATDDWDNARNAEVARLAALLPTDPLGALHGLSATAEGCDFLADAWDLLAQTLEDTGEFDAASRTHAARLLGHPALDVHSLDLRLRRLSSLCAAIDAQDAEALTNLDMFLTERVEEFSQRGDDLWERLDAPDRAAAPKRAYFDASAEGQRLMRYIAAAERMWRRALQELAEYRRAYPVERRRHEPAAAKPPAAPVQNEPGAAQVAAPQKPATPAPREPLSRDVFVDPIPQGGYIAVAAGNGKR